MCRLLENDDLPGPQVDMGGFHHLQMEPITEYTEPKLEFLSFADGTVIKFNTVKEMRDFLLPTGESNA